MKHEFSEAILANAFQAAARKGHTEVALLIASRLRESPEGKLIDAAARGDEQAIRRLLGLGPAIGERMPDDTVYAGVSPDSGKRIFTATTNAPQMMTFTQARDHALTLDACGHKDWRLPTVGELKMLFNARSKIGGFVTKPGCVSVRWYWSSTELRNDPSNVWAVVFTDGHKDWVDKNNYILSSRMVRAEP